MSYLTLKSSVALVVMALISAGFPAAAAQKNSAETASGNANTRKAFSGVAGVGPANGLYRRNADWVEPTAQPALTGDGLRTFQAIDALMSVANAGMQASHSELDGLRAYRITQDRNAPQSNVWGH